MAWNREAVRSAIVQGIVAFVSLPIYFIPPPQVAKRAFPLIDAIKAGDLQQVRALLEQGEDPNSRETQAEGKWWFRKYRIDVPQEMAKTALMLAAGTGNLEIVRQLLESGADVNSRAGLGDTALGWALDHDGPVEVAKLLIDRGADVNAGYEPPLTIATAARRVDQVSLLLERGAEVNAVDEEGFTALMEPAGSGYEEVVAILIAAGIDVNARNKEGFTALYYAREKRQARIVKLLTEAGARE